MKFRHSLQGVITVILAIFTLGIGVVMFLGMMYPARESTILEGIIALGFIISLLVYFPIMVYNLKKDKAGIYSEEPTTEDKIDKISRQVSEIRNQIGGSKHA